MMRWLPVAAAVLTSCDCAGGSQPDAGRSGADSAVDAGDAASDAAPDASADGGGEPLTCGSDACSDDEPYCCALLLDELAPYSCFDRPTMPDETETVVICWESPVAAGAILRDCSADEECPLDHPWCCSGVGGRAYCAPKALFGWECRDLTGADAGRPAHYEEDLILRCAEDQPCPAEYPYCCDDLFCADEAFHGWSCAVR